MTCTVVDVGGIRAIVCGRGLKVRACKACGKPATKLCDWRTGPRSTCSIPLCDQCASSPAPGKDLCPGHNAEWATHPSNPASPYAIAPELPLELTTSAQGSATSSTS